MREVTVQEKALGLKVRVRVGGDEAAAHQAAAKWTGALMSNSEEVGEAVAWAFNDQDKAFIWLAEWPETSAKDNFGSLVHECVHVAMSFLREHMRLNVHKAEETCCYLVQHFYTEISHKLDSRRSRK
jgi:hypothetical protein